MRYFPLTKVRRLLLLVCAIFMVGTLSAIPPRPEPARFVADFAGVFPDAEQVMLLEDYLGQVSDSTGVQVQVVTVPDLEGEAPFMYARQIGEEWGVGDENKNNGVVILIKPRDETGGEVFIATGYGSECLLTDIECDMIIERYMLDYLREDNYFAAADAGARVCAEVMVSGNDTLLSSASGSNSGWSFGDYLGMGVLMLPFLLGFIALLKSIYIMLSPKHRARRKIEGAETAEELQAALAKAEEVKLSPKDREEALAQMRERLYTIITSADNPSQQAERIASFAGMPLSADRINHIVADMKENTYRSYVDCQSSASLRGRMLRAIAFGNDKDDMLALYAGLLANLKAIEAARKAAEEKARRERSRSGGGHGGGRSYGGGHFGGGGAGRHF